MPILDSRGNVKRPKGPRRTKCSSCDSVLIEGDSGIEKASLYGIDFVICPGCALDKLYKTGMKAEQMTNFDIVRKDPTPGESGWGLGIVISIKGIHNEKNKGLQMVITEEQLKDFISQIEEVKEGGV